MNPAIDKAAHVLNLNKADNQPSLANVRAAVSYYRLQSAEADQTANEVVGLVGDWEELARRHRLSSLERLEARWVSGACRLDTR